MDDVINVSGHRLGTAEVEDVMMEHPEVSETAVVGCPHALKGETIFAFLVQIRLSIEQIAPALPKTRSGKIMRRLLRQIAKGNLEDLGDTSTLADPAAVETVLKLYRQMPVKPTS
ncbi:hypothetical protein HAZT_HAZT007023 [Hyalella azteca]|uniref:AMP-binding enzyme C-terminal domain-containing protein n=1 Tax=Hyalella azteca TaxID=294128 RepID=A0A6A0H8D5_HYAAZ|nr:hypothetical protein HAZT_HAZT007023 [Hyalella azteca]